MLRLATNGASQRVMETLHDNLARPYDCAIVSEKYQGADGKKPACRIIRPRIPLSDGILLFILAGLLKTPCGPSARARSETIRRSSFSASSFQQSFQLVFGIYLTL
jgi:hypothetical protein